MVTAAMEKEMAAARGSGGGGRSGRRSMVRGAEAAACFGALHVNCFCSLYARLQRLTLHTGTGRLCW